MQTEQMPVAIVQLLGPGGQKLVKVKIQKTYRIEEVVEHRGRFFKRYDDNGEVFIEVDGKGSICEAEEP